MAFNSNDVLLHAAKYVKERNEEIEKNINLAKAIFEPFKEIYKRKKTVGMLWWKKTIFEDIFIRYEILNKSALDIVVIKIRFDIDDIFSYVDLYVKKHDMLSFCDGVMHPSLKLQFVKLYESGKKYLVKPIE